MHDSNFFLIFKFFYRPWNILFKKGFYSWMPSDFSFKSWSLAPFVQNAITKQHIFFWIRHKIRVAFKFEKKKAMKELSYHAPANIHKLWKILAVEVRHTPCPILRWHLGLKSLRFLLFREQHPGNCYYDSKNIAIRVFCTLLMRWRKKADNPNTFTMNAEDRFTIRKNERGF